MATNFPTSLDSYTTKTDNVDDVMASHINNVQDAIEALQAKVGVDGSSTTDTLDYLVKNFITSGRKVYLYENAAPTGWSIVSVTDAVLAVKGGSNAYNTTGGQTGGTWTQPDHTLTESEIPAHTHGSAGAHTHSLGIRQPSGNYQTDYKTNDGSDAGSMMSSDSAGSHTHSSVGGGNAHNHGTTWRPKGAVGIIVSKD